jgi:hypothetical protein
MASMRARGRRIAIGTGAAAAIVVAGALIVSSDLLWEEWYLHRFLHADDATADAAIEKLCERGRARTLRRLLESFCKRETRRSRSAAPPKMDIFNFNFRGRPLTEEEAAELPLFANVVIESIERSLEPGETAEYHKGQVIATARDEIHEAIARNRNRLNWIMDLEWKLGAGAIPAQRGVSRNESLPKPVRDLAAHDLEVLLRDHRDRS